VLIRTEHRTIGDVLRRIDDEFIVLDPEFQRDFVWSEDRQSRLIESVLMRIPLPVFYFAENEDGKLVVVDGLQRLTSFRRFLKGELKLELLKSKELHGKTIGGLSKKLQNRFEDGQLTLFLIDAKAPDRVRMDIFERVNSGVSLTRQQMRNALYSGPSTKLLRELVQEQAFTRATGGSISKDKHRKDMKDREAVNRFLAFRVLGWEAYASSQGYDDFLGDALGRINREPKRIAEHRKAFLASMERNLLVFERHAFRKHKSAAEGRSPLNLALFDVFSVLLIQWDEARVVARKTRIQKGFYGLIRDRKFHDSISFATASPASVKTRFTRAHAMLRGVLDDP
jgi:hypothetical protein